MLSGRTVQISHSVTCAVNLTTYRFFSCKLVGNLYRLPLSRGMRNSFGFFSRKRKYAIIQLICRYGIVSYFCGGNGFIPQLFRSNCTVGNIILINANPLPVCPIVYCTTRFIVTKSILLLKCVAYTIIIDDKDSDMTGIIRAVICYNACPVIYKLTYSAAAELCRIKLQQNPIMIPFAVCDRSFAYCVKFQFGQSF